jgi:hypothetical protein
MFCTSHSMCAVHSMDVFCSSLISCLPGMLIKYFLNVLEMVPVAPIIVGIIFFYIPHALYFYYKAFIF